MWIRTTREARVGNEFKDPRVGELNDGDPVSFNDNGTAQVPDAVGEYLIEEFPDEYERTDGGPARDDETDDEEDTEEDN